MVDANDGAELGVSVMRNHLQMSVRWRRLTRIGVALIVALSGACVAVTHASAASDPATQFYVDPAGNDSWAGTKARPFATLERAQAAVRAATPSMASDIIVNLRAGTHLLTQPLQLSNARGDSGRFGHRVVYQAYGYGTSGQETAVVSGGRRITGWTKVLGSQNVWRADVGDLDTRQLYVAGRRAQRATLSQNLPELTLTPTGYMTDSTVPQSWAHPEDIEFVFTGAWKWSEPRCGVASVVGTPASTTITMDQPCFRRAVALSAGGEALGGGLLPRSIENSSTFLTAPGTFYLDRSLPGGHVLFYIPRAGEDLSRDPVVAPVLETLIEGTGRADAPLHDVTLRGLTFSYATWLQPDAAEGFPHYIAGLYEVGDPSVWGVTLSDQARFMPGQVSFLYSDGILLERNLFEHLGGQALEMVGSDDIVRGNQFTDVAGGAILVGDYRPEITDTTSRDDVVADNWIHDIGVQYHGSVGIFAVRTSDVTIAHNQINDLPYDGIFLGWGHQQVSEANGAVDALNEGAQILSNHVFDAMNVLTDGGGIYTSFRQGASYAGGALVRGNVVHDLDDQHRGADVGIYTDWGSSWVTVADNVVYDVAMSAGGCSIPGVAQIHDIAYTNNFWIHEAPTWSCTQPENIVADGNRVLPTTDTEAACQAIPACAAILNGAGLESAYRDLLG